MELQTQWLFSNKFSNTPWVRFTKQGKLAPERNKKILQMGMNISASDLLTTRKLLYIIIYKLNIVQCNIPRAE